MQFRCNFNEIEAKKQQKWVESDIVRLLDVSTTKVQLIELYNFLRKSNPEIFRLATVKSNFYNKRKLFVDDRGRDRSAGWNLAIEQAKCSIARNGRLCVLHFTEDDFIRKSGKILLKPGVVPTLFPDESLQIYEDGAQSANDPYM